MGCTRMSVEPTATAGTTGDRSVPDSATPKTFTGDGNLIVWLKKMDVWCALKGYRSEKMALAMASRLDGPDFECYVRMTDEDQQQPDQIVSSLRREFIRAERDRETAIHDLSQRQWRTGESPAAFAYELSRLTKLVYPEFGDLAQQTIARDTFIKGLPSEIQVELRKDTSTNTKSVQDLAAEVVRLQLAGVGNPKPSAHACAVSKDIGDSQQTHLVDQIAERVCQLMTGTVDFKEDETGHIQTIRYQQTGRARGPYSGSQQGPPRYTSLRLPHLR